MTRTLAVVSAGLSRPSSSRLLADRLAAATVRAVPDEVDVRTIELRGHAHSLVDAMLSGFPPQDLKPVLDTVASADGLIVVTPTYAASYSGLFKSFVDVLDEGVVAGKPVLIGATGGTERHSLVLDYAMRPLFTYLKAIVVPTGVYAASEDWAGNTLSARIDRAAGELAHELAVRERAVVADPFANPTPFEHLLSGS
ncbi:NADPH-dependent FMN reductase [Kibdelosporangium aridum]|uniref:NADPH-dependent FMN reductase n=1 Tax=Kibdelosporangium aridum TaxID=2030 RepID=A0A428YXJ7_KIBAR|nr:FMN reductase [Kibdelosporangium aridum]RSM74762.1 NADPH-dependent FMN reductase [Kibdelosporangium aridum]